LVVTKYGLIDMIDMWFSFGCKEISCNAWYGI